MKANYDELAPGCIHEEGDGEHTPLHYFLRIAVETS